MTAKIRRTKHSGGSFCHYSVGLAIRRSLDTRRFGGSFLHTVGHETGYLVFEDFHLALLLKTCQSPLCDELAVSRRCYTYPDTIDGHFRNRRYFRYRPWLVAHGRPLVIEITSEKIISSIERVLLICKTMMSGGQ